VHQAQQEDILLRAFGERKNVTTHPKEFSIPDPKALKHKIFVANNDPEKIASAVKALSTLKGLGKTIAQQLAEAGIMSLEQLAQLSEKDKERLEKVIPGFTNKYKRNDWKKQAMVSSES